MVNSVAVGSQPLVNESMPEAARVERLRPFFEPPIGGHLQLDPMELSHLRHRQNPFELRGFIVVKPPDGTCFSVMRNRKIPDNYVCERQTLSFDLRQMGADGAIHWWVITGDGDFGTPAIWPTPYRAMKYIRLGKLFLAEPEVDLLMSCQVVDKVNRRIIVKTAGGRQITVKFPKKDIKLPSKTRSENLTIFQPRNRSLSLVTEKKPDGIVTSNSGSNVSGIKAEEPVVKTQDELEQEEAQRLAAEKAGIQGAEEAGKKKKWNFGLSGGEGKSFSYYWTLRSGEIYHMPATQVFSDQPADITGGKCRYMLKDSPLSPTDGIVECIFVDAYDVVVIPLSCSSELL